MRCNDLNDQMRAKQNLRFGGPVKADAKLSVESNGASTNAVLPGISNALKQGFHGEKAGRKLDLNG